MSLRFPLLPALLFEMHGVGLPVTAPFRSPLLSPAVQLLNVFPAVVVVTDLSFTDSALPPKLGLFTVLPVGGAPAFTKRCTDSNGCQSEPVRVTVAPGL